MKLMTKEKVEKMLRGIKSLSEEDTEKLLFFLSGHGFYEGYCSSHDNWEGGLAQHSLRTATYGPYVRDTLMKKDTGYLRYVTDDDIFITGLLHDVCNIYQVGFNGTEQYVCDKAGKGVHGGRSMVIVKDLIGLNLSKPQLYAIQDHRHGTRPHPFENEDERVHYQLLLDVLQKCDRQAAGTCWNSTRYKSGRRQSNRFHGDLRIEALDRTFQMCIFKKYLDYRMEFHRIREINRDHIKWNSFKGIAENLHNLYKEKIDLPSDKDFVTGLRSRQKKLKHNAMLIVGCDASIPKDGTNNLRATQNNYERDLLICSNLLVAMYLCVNGRSDPYAFSMHPDVKKHYQQLERSTGIYIPQVQFIRDGFSEGFRQVSPWTIDVLMVPNMKLPPFVIA